MSYKRLRKLYEVGKTIQEIANYYEVSLNCIYARLKKSGVIMRPTGSRRTAKEKEALADRILSLRIQNLTYEQIATIVGISRSSVRRYLKSKI
jgi:response regulator of citrate/malate metabolism